MTFTLRTLALLFLFTSFTACIGDDIVEDFVAPQIRITNAITEIEAGTNYQFEHSFNNNIGISETITAEWSTGNTDLLTVDNDGLATAVAEGNTTITVSFTDEFDNLATRDYDIEVGASTVVVVEPMFRNGTVATTTFYDLEGDFTLSEDETGETNDLTLSFGDDYRADNGLPGLFVYLSNNPNSINGAFEIARVDVFSGAHDYTIAGVNLNEYRYVLYFCKPFNVKVGDGEISE
jgi:hypothetical protein